MDECTIFDLFKIVLLSDKKRNQLVHFRDYFLLKLVLIFLQDENKVTN